KQESVIDMSLLEHSVRDNLNKKALRVMAVLNPLKVVITNYPGGLTEEIEAVNNPEDPGMGTRKVPFSGELYIEKDDFMENPPKKFFRLSPGVEVRLRYAYFIKCTEVIKNEMGEVTELRCTYDPATRGGDAPDGRKVKATIHWVSAKHAINAEVRLYDRLFTEPEPGSSDGDYKDSLNPDSLLVLKDCRLEPGLVNAEPGVNYQFERIGYFTPDTRVSKIGAPVFNRTVTLKDTWAKEKDKQD
ncbi:MAG: glutamine--tRNA ligase, partial [Thermodesulfobacteriota bacterium]